MFELFEKRQPGTFWVWRGMLWVGFSLLLTALLLVSYPYLRNRLSQEKWVPLSIPISLSKATIVTPEFRPVLDEEYYIYVEAERKIEFHRLNCLLGVVDFLSCGGEQEVIDIGWTLSKKGKPIAAGRSQNEGSAWSGLTIQRGIGRFHGGNGMVCVIAATINKDASELNQTNPKLTVSVDPSVWEGPVIFQQMAFYIAMLLAVAGVGFLVLGLISRVLDKKRGRL